MLCHSVPPIIGHGSLLVVRLFPFNLSRPEVFFERESYSFFAAPYDGSLRLFLLLLSFASL